MSLENHSHNLSDGLIGADAPHFSDAELCAEGGAEVAPWTEIDPGRYMPRRVRGSYHGRALG